MSCYMLLTSALYKSLGAGRLSCSCALQPAHHSLLLEGLLTGGESLLLCAGSVPAWEPDPAVCSVGCQVMKAPLGVAVWFQSSSDPFRFLETNQNSCLSNPHSCPRQDLGPQDADLIQTWVFLDFFIGIVIQGWGLSAPAGWCRLIHLLLKSQDINVLISWGSLGTWSGGIYLSDISKELQWMSQLHGTEIRCVRNWSSSEDLKGCIRQMWVRFWIRVKVWQCFVPFPKRRGLAQPGQKEQEFLQCPGMLWQEKGSFCRTGSLPGFYGVWISPCSCHLLTAPPASPKGFWAWKMEVKLQDVVTEVIQHYILYSVTLLKGSAPPFLGRFSAFQWNSSGNPMGSSEELFKGATANWFFIFRTKIKSKNCIEQMFETL